MIPGQRQQQIPQHYFSEGTAAAASQNLEERDYWLKKLSGPWVKSTFPYDNDTKSENEPGPEHCLELTKFGFSPDLTAMLTRLSNNSDYALHIILFAGMVALLYKYTGNKDIILGAPIYTQKIQGDFINTVLALRSRWEDKMTFKELLLQVKQTVVDADENQNYPMETLLYKLNVPYAKEDFFPLFDIALLLENIHSKSYIQHIHINMIFSFTRTNQGLEGRLEFNPRLYEIASIERIVEHYTHLLKIFCSNLDLPLASLSTLPGKEKKQILVDFNNSEVNFPRDKTVYYLIREEAEKKPHRLAIVFRDQALTYRELEQRANQLAWVLRDSGLNRDQLVGIMMKRSASMVVSILAAWKAGGAYLPIEPHYPGERIKYMLADSGTKFLLTTAGLAEKFAGLPVDCQFLIVKEAPSRHQKINNYPLTINNLPLEQASLAYLIYTSGSTGKPKGAMVEHMGMMNHLHAKIHDLNLSETSIIAQNASHTFDISVWQFFAALITGGKTVIYPGQLILEPERFISAVSSHCVTILEEVPSYLSLLLDLPGTRFLPLDSLQYLVVTGEELGVNLVRKWFKRYPAVKMVNAYGPTEASDDITHHIMDKFVEQRQVPIGIPLQNLDIYILDKNMNLCPIGVKGEIYVAGVGVGRGYLNNPELTNKKFLLGGPGGAVFSKSAPPGRRRQKTYITGDLGRWLSNGAIVFCGRKDYQVKIRGYRIELEEIETHLMSHPAVKEAVVSDKQYGSGDIYLCAYVVTVTGAGLDIPEIKKYLSGRLPDYMIPTYFLALEQMPLTENGKIDRSALPLPEPEGGESQVNIVMPRNTVEKQLAAIWSEVLKVNRDSISIDANFFDFGGHSLKATLLIAKIHKAFNVKIPILEVFKTPFIRDLARYIARAGQEEHTSINIAETKEYYALSPAQKRLYILQQLEIKNTRYNVPVFLELEGVLEKKKLEKTFLEMIQRHEGLRTSFRVVNEVPVQKVHDKVEFEIEYYETRDNGRDIIDNFVRPFDLARAPLLRVGLVKWQERKQVLMLDIHHIVTDGTSNGIFVKDVVTLYRGENLPGLKLRYRDYSQWQNQEKNKKKIKQQEDYWLEQYPGEIPVLDIITDYPRPALQSFAGDQSRFALNKRETARLKEMARDYESTLYMVLLAVFNIFLAKLSSQEDIIVGAPIAGRRHAEIQNILGVFINTLALRNFPAGQRTVLEFLKEVRERTLAAYENQDYPFENLVDMLDIHRDIGRNPLFDVLFVFQNFEIERFELEGLIIKPFGYKNKTSKFDLGFFMMEAEEAVFIAIEYCTKLFKPGTIRNFTSYFKRIIGSILENPHQEIAGIEILSGKEKSQILYDFNDTAAGFPLNKTIPQLLREQAEKAPDDAAVIFKDHWLTYCQLEERANGLSGLLKSKGLGRGQPAALLTERSLEMIVGILGVLKAGGACLPIDMEYPQQRKRYMIRDSGAKLLLTTDHIEPAPGYIPDEVEIVNLKGENIYCRARMNPDPRHVRQGRNSDPLYVIYTSGSTGKPKGIILEHRNLVNLIMYQYKYTNIDFSKVLQFTTISFDVSFQEIFSTLIAGGELFLVEKEVRNNIPALFKFIEAVEIKTLFLPASYLKFVLNEENYIELVPGSVAHIVTAGEQLIITDKIRNYLRLNRVFLHNHYGPSETHVVTTLTLDPREEIPEIPSIGKPVADTRIYIYDQQGHLQPPGIPGELYIGGGQVGRGYLNNPEMTAEKFHHDLWDYQDDRKGKKAPGKKFYMSHMSHMSYIYKTGDLARWLEDGNIEFRGRIDHQVKIRGYRVELGEIENQLLNHPGVKETVVIINQDDRGDKHIIAYIATSRELSVPELRNFLAQNLPDYMVPLYFVKLDKIPLTPNRKIDHNALPGPETAVGDDDTAPRNEIEEKLAAIWADILGGGDAFDVSPNQSRAPVNIDDNFFARGGHSLKATILIAKIHRQLNVKVPLAEVFKNPTIRGLSGYIKNLAADKYTSVEPVEEKDYYVLSPAQKRLYIFQQMNRESTAYNMPTVVPFAEEPDLEKLEQTFKKLIHRHESLRTSFHMAGDHVVQRIHHSHEIEFTIKQDCRETDSTEDIFNHFIKPFDMSKAPLLRAGMIKAAKAKHFLIFDVHHNISDGVSIGILVRDFLRLYRGEKLPGLRIWYKDYAEHQNSEPVKEKMKNHEAYWLKRFSGQIPVLNLPTDYPRPAVQNFDGSSIEFQIREEETAALNQLGLNEDATLYIVLLAIYNIMLSKMSRQEDIIVGTPIAGRQHVDLHQLIGMFVNTLPMRNYPRAEMTFKEFLSEVKKNTLASFENQEYYLENLVPKVALNRDAGRNPIFDVMFALHNMNIPVTERSTLKSKTDEYINIHRTSKFDLSFLAEEIAGKLFITVEYSTKLFKKETIQRFTGYFQEIVSTVLANKNIKLKNIEISYDLGTAKTNLIETDFVF